MKKIRRREDIYHPLKLNKFLKRFQNRLDSANTEPEVAVISLINEMATTLAERVWEKNIPLTRDDRSHVGGIIMGKNPSFLQAVKVHRLNYTVSQDRLSSLAHFLYKITFLL